MKTCFGTIYPDLSGFQFGKGLIGKVFRLQVDTRGGGQRDVHLEVNQPEWENYQPCESYKGCLGLSNAKLHM